LIRILVLAGLLLAAVVRVGAINVQGLYAAEVLIADTSPAGRSDGELRALQAVLVKLTGDRDVDVLAVLTLYGSSVSTLVQQSQLRVSGERGTERLWVQFDDTQIDRLLSAANTQQWGRTRPMTAFLIAIDDGTERSVLSAGETSGFAETVNLASRRRAVPTVLPLMDLRDQRDLSADDIFAVAVPRMEVLRQRYRGETLVFGSLSKRQQAWEAAWTLRVAGSERRWSQRGAPNQLLDEMVETVADELAARFASGARPSSSVQPINAAAPLAVPARSAQRAVDSNFQAIGPQALPVPSGSPVPGVARVPNVPRSSGTTYTPTNAVTLNPPIGVSTSQVASPGNVAVRPLVQSIPGMALTVVGVRSVSDYGAVLLYLREIDQVSAVLVTAVVGDRVDLVVRSNAGDAALRQIIDIGYTLLPDPGAGQATYRLR